MKIGFLWRGAAGIGSRIRNPVYTRSSVADQLESFFSNVADVFSFIVKAIIIYTIINIAGYIQLVFYNTELLKLLFEYPLLLTAAVLLVQSQQFSVFVFLTGLILVFIIIPAVTYIYWFFCYLVFNVIYTILELFCMFIGAIQWIFISSLYALIGPLAALCLFSVILFLPSVSRN